MNDVAVRQVDRSFRAPGPAFVGAWDRVARAAGAPNRKAWIVAILDAAAGGPLPPRGYVLEGRARLDPTESSVSIVSMTVDEARVVRWELAAADCAMPLNKWVIIMLNEASGISHTQAHLQRLRRRRRRNPAPDAA